MCINPHLAQLTIPIIKLKTAYKPSNNANLNKNQNQ